MGFHPSSCVPVKITSGAYWKTLPDTLAYEATIPLTYTTKWHQTLFEASLTRSVNCGKRQKPFCELGDPLRSLISQARQQILSIDTAIDPSSYNYMISTTGRTKRALDFLGDGLSWCCGVATQHKLDSLVIDENKLRTKLEKVYAGLKSVFHQITSDSQAFKDYSQEVAQNFATIRDRFKVITNIQNEEGETLYNLTSELEGNSQYLLNLFFLHLQNSIATTHTLRKSQIMQDCRAHMIPNLIVTPKVLRSDLKRLTKILHDSDQDLAIPLQDVSKYYKLPLCDCAVSDSEITVHIRIPIAQKDTTWKLYELLTTPFAWNNETCVVMHDAMYLAVPEVSSAVDSSPPMRPVAGSGLHNCKPYEHRLCYVPRFSADNTYGPQCAFSMYRGASVEELAKACAFRCHSSKALVISEVREDVYVITHPRPNTSLVCDSKIEPLPDSVLNQPGALQITLPCHCSLTIGNQSIIPRRFPCTPESAPRKGILHVLPATWSNLKSLHLEPLDVRSHPIFHNLSACLNHNWTLTVPHLNLSTDYLKTDLTSQLSESLDNLEEITSHLSTHSDRLLVFWNVLLSLSIIYLVRRNRILALSLELLKVKTTTAKGTDGLKAADKTFVLVVVFVSIYTIAVMIWLSLTLCRKCCTKPNSTEVAGIENIEAGRSDDLEEDDEQGVPLKEVRLHSKVALPRLSKGKTREASY